MEEDIHIEEEARNGYVKNLEEKIPNNIRLQVKRNTTIEHKEARFMTFPNTIPIFLT